MWINPTGIVANIKFDNTAKQSYVSSICQLKIHPSSSDFQLSYVSHWQNQKPHSRFTNLKGLQFRCPLRTISPVTKKFSLLHRTHDRSSFLSWFFFPQTFTLTSIKPTSSRIQFVHSASKPDRRQRIARWTKIENKNPPSIQGCRQIRWSKMWRGESKR